MFVRDYYDDDANCCYCCNFHACTPSGLGANIHATSIPLSSASVHCRNFDNNTDNGCDNCWDDILARTCSRHR